MNVPLNIDWQQILLHLLNFVVLFAVLYFLLYEPVKKFMDQRCEHYRNMDDEAKKNLKQAEDLKTEYDKRLHSVDGEIEEKRQAAYKSLSEKTSQSMLLAKQEAEQIISDAHKKAEEDRKKLFESAQNEITDMAAKAAEKIVVNASTSDAYDNFLGSVKRSDVNE